MVIMMMSTGGWGGTYVHADSLATGRSYTNVHRTRRAHACEHCSISVHVRRTRYIPPTHLHTSHTYTQWEHAVTRRARGRRNVIAGSAYVTRMPKQHVTVITPARGRLFGSSVPSCSLSGMTTTLHASIPRGRLQHTHGCAKGQLHTQAPPDFAVPCALSACSHAEAPAACSRALCPAHKHAAQASASPDCESLWARLCGSGGSDLRASIKTVRPMMAIASPNAISMGDDGVTPKKPHMTAMSRAEIGTTAATCRWRAGAARRQARCAHAGRCPRHRRAATGATAAARHALAPAGARKAGPAPARAGGSARPGGHSAPPSLVPAAPPASSRARAPRTCPSRPHPPPNSTRRPPFAGAACRSHRAL